MDGAARFRHVDPASTIVDEQHHCEHDVEQVRTVLAPCSPAPVVEFGLLGNVEQLGRCWRRVGWQLQQFPLPHIDVAFLSPAVAHPAGGGGRVVPNFHFRGLAGVLCGVRLPHRTEHGTPGRGAGPPSLCELADDVPHECTGLRFSVVVGLRSVEWRASTISAISPTRVWLFHGCW